MAARFTRGLVFSVPFLCVSKMNVLAFVAFVHLKFQISNSRSLFASSVTPALALSVFISACLPVARVPRLLRSLYGFVLDIAVAKLSSSAMSEFPDYKSDCPVVQPVERSSDR
jgi:hypothetical protein